MPKRVTWRPLTIAERQELERLNRSKTAEYRLVQRAQFILAVHNGEIIPQVAQRFGVTPPTVYARLKRFETEGLQSLQDRERSGRDPIYSEQDRGTMISIARTHPDTLAQPFGTWTLDRLVEYLRKEHDMGVSRAQLARILKDEGLRWYQEKVYFTERPDPQFAEKRGR